jgi:hypothetical protein
MKSRLLSILTAALAASFLIAAPAAYAQDDEDAPAPSPEELRERLKEWQQESKKKSKEAKETIHKMLKVFKPLEGEWTGDEKVEHTEEPYKALDKAWKDEWKGFYTMEGVYFEMTGKTQGDEATEYRWICTWDVTEETYKAWYFGVNGQTLYTGELSKDGKHVVWTTESEENDSSTVFSMIPDGDRVKCDGKDRMNGRIFSRQSSSYTRKKVAI